MKWFHKQLVEGAREDSGQVFERTARGRRTRVYHGDPKALQSTGTRLDSCPRRGIVPWSAGLTSVQTFGVVTRGNRGAAQE